MLTVSEFSYIFEFAFNVIDKKDNGITVYLDDFIFKALSYDLEDSNVDFFLFKFFEKGWLVKSF